MAQLIDGKKIAAQVKQKVSQEVAQLKAQGITPQLAVIIVGENAASQIYVRNKARDCGEVGIVSRVVALPEDVTEQRLLDEIAALNADDAVSAMLVQLPLPAHIDKSRVIDAIAPQKDADCFCPRNIGELFLGSAALRPCTPAGVIELLDAYDIPIMGADCVIIGRSDIVGKPLALMLEARDATVTLCHSKTRDLAEKAARADILVAAIGKPRFVTGDMIKPGAAVVDVGINRLEDGSLCGDVDFAAAMEKAAFVTPVPGGVGLMTRAALLENTVTAAKNRAGSR